MKTATQSLAVRPDSTVEGLVCEIKTVMRLNTLAIAWNVLIFCTAKLEAKVGHVLHTVDNAVTDHLVACSLGRMGTVPAAIAEWHATTVSAASPLRSAL